MKKNTLENFISRSNKRHNSKYDYSRVIYINNYSKVEIICPVHGSFWQKAKNHYRSGCKLCSYAALASKDFVKRSKKVHKNKYDYTNVVYVNQLVPVIIVCPVHGQFDQLPKSHVKGCGCRKCFDEKTKYNQGSTETFIAAAKQILKHKNKYEYHLVNYVHSKSPVIIICKKHGEFCRTPNSHLRGHGCSECAGNKKLNTKIFTARASVVHDYKYDYSLTNYTICFDKVQIICPIHGMFSQVAQDHLGGHGCHKCYKNVSKVEVDWLNFMQVPDDQEHRNLYVRGNNKRYKVDGFYNNTVYEFYGDFWHGNPSKFNRDDINLVNKISFGDLYDKTMRRETEISNLGYKVVSIWESDWLEQKKQAA